MSDNDVYGPVISGSASIAGAALTGKANKKMQREAMAWQTSERQAAQAYNTSERLASQNWQQQQRLDQNQFAIDVYNQYKSPKSLVEQYKAAGLNPRLAMNSAGDLSAASGSSGSAPSGTHVQPATVGAPYQDINSFSSGFKSIAEGLSSLAAAKKSGVETYRIEQLLDSEVRSSQAKALMDQILTSLKVKYGDLEVQSHLRNLFAEINNKNANTDKVRAELDWLKSKKALTDKEVQTFDERFRKEMANLDSSTDSNESTARLHDAVAAVQPTIADLNRALTSKTIQETLTEAERTQLVHFNSIVANTEAIISKLNRGRLLEADRAQLEAAKQQAIRIRDIFYYKNKYKEFGKYGKEADAIMVYLDSFIGSIGQVLSGAAVVAPGSRVFGRSAGSSAAAGASAGSSISLPYN